MLEIWPIVTIITHTGPGGNSLYQATDAHVYMHACTRTHTHTYTAHTTQRTHHTQHIQHSTQTAHTSHAAHTHTHTHTHITCSTHTHIHTHTLLHTQCVYFVNSGSEANDLAIIMARMHTKNWDMLCLRNAYHGMSIGTMGTCGQHTWKQAMPQVGRLCVCV